MARRRGVDAEYRVTTEGADKAEKEVGGIASAFDDLGNAIPGPAGEISDVISDLSGGGIAGAAGAVAGIGAAFVYAATEAVEAAKQAETIAAALDTSVEDASRMGLAFEQIGEDADVVVELALTVGEALEDDAELAEQLGINLEESSGPAEQLGRAINNWDLLTPTQRIKVFGEEGVLQISRLIRQGKSWEEILASFSDGQVIDDAEAARARELEATIQDLKGVWDSIVLTVGQEVVDAVNGVTGAVELLGGALDAVVGPWTDLLGGIDSDVLSTFFVGGAEAAVTLKDKITGELTPGIVDFGDKSAAAMGELEEGADGATVSIGKISAAYSLLTDKLADRSAYLDVQDAFDNVEAKAIDSWNAAAEGSDDAEAKARDYERAQIALTQKVIAYAEEVGNLPDEVITDILADIDQGSLNEAEAALTQLERDRTARLTVAIGYTSSYNGNPGGPPSDIVPGARSASAPQTQATPTATSGSANFAAVAAPSVTNVTVNLPAASQGRDVVRSIDRWANNNGRT